MAFVFGTEFASVSNTGKPLKTRIESICSSWSSLGAVLSIPNDILGINISRPVKVFRRMPDAKYANRGEHRGRFEDIEDPLVGEGVAVDPKNEFDQAVHGAGLLGQHDSQSGGSLTAINEIEMHMALYTPFHPDGAVAFAWPSRNTILENRPRITANMSTVTSWVARPAIRTSTPIFSVSPCQLLDEAIPEPDAWMRKERISQITKTFAILRHGIPKMVCESEGKTAVIRRPIVT